MRWPSSFLGRASAAVVGLLCVVLVVGALTGNWSGPSGTAGDRAPKVEPADPSAELACGHFRNVMADVDAGILSDAEIRAKLQEVHRDAAGSQRVGGAATRLLRAATLRDVGDLPAARSEMTRVCAGVGR